MENTEYMTKALNRLNEEFTYTVMQPDGGSFRASVMWPKVPGYDALSKLLKSLLKADFEHVSVLYNDKRADMFVDDEGMLRELPVNDAATKIYRAAYLVVHPEFPPDELSKIHGPAVLFDKRVWF